MSGCLDQISCNCNIDWDGKRNGVASIVAATLFFSAWWLMLDTAAVYDKKDWTNVSEKRGILKKRLDFLQRSTAKM